MSKGHSLCPDSDLIVISSAYPHSDPTIKRVYTARLGETIEMQCTIPIGVLRNRYSVQWYKGINTEITNSTSDEFGHIGVNENSGALVFSGVKAYDASKGYFCAMTVEMVRGDVCRQGSTIALHVSGECIQSLCADTLTRIFLGVHVLGCKTKVVQ